MKFLTPFAVMTLLAGAALAQEPPPGQPYAPPPGGQMAPPPGGAPMAPPHMGMMQRFDAANTTHDGKLTLPQAQAAGLTPVVRHFAQIDRDHKGYVTVQDLREFHQAMMAQRQAGQGGMAPPPGGQMAPPAGGQMAPPPGYSPPPPPPQ